MNQPNIMQDMDFYEVKLGVDEYFLMGDNRTGSTDSRILDLFIEVKLYLRIC